MVTSGKRRQLLWNNNRSILAKTCIARFLRGWYGRTLKTILAPVDFSSATEAVVAEAARLAAAVQGRVVLLSIIQPPVITSEYAPLMENMAEITAAGEKAAAKHLASLHEQLRQQDVPCETEQLNGAPIQHIIDQAKKCSADYIVMGSHGHTALYDLLVGSTTHGVLLRATCPVVIVPAARRERLKRPII